MNSKRLYRKPIVKLIDSLRYKPVRILSLIILAPMLFIGDTIVRTIVHLVENLPESLGLTKQFISDVIHWDELEG